jgi:hypothetical protein
MQTARNPLQVLRDELAFLNHGGYRSPIGWRCAFVFEDSPTCVKGQLSTCPHDQCVLLSFVPRDSRHQPIPCRHIPLTESGETLDTLYRTGTNEEIEHCLRNWLLATITRLEGPSVIRRADKVAA